MSELKCPYCKTEQDVSRKGGFEEDELYDEVCKSCKKTFKFEVVWSPSFISHCKYGHEMYKLSECTSSKIYLCKNCEYSLQK